MDSELPWHRRLAVKLHLLYCVWCRRYAAQLQFLRQACKQVPAESLEAAPQKLSTEAKQQMRTRLQEAVKNLPYSPE